MRVKWNRHLDGSSSRRQEDGSEGVSEEIQPSKEKNKHSSPSIFRIFRRKKSRQRPDSSCDSALPSSKRDLPPFLETPAPSEADEDDCASISSVATCASQPVNEVCHRDRTLSLFSSFRLSFPKKKKKRATESSDGQVLDNRFSSPDLRRHPSDNVQPLSSSSQSVPNTKDASKSLRCLEELRMENSESLGKLKCPSSEAKLVKSVSFSECKLPSPCSRLPVENINEMNDKTLDVNGTVLEANLVPCFSAPERKMKLLSDVTSSDFIPERQSGISDMLDSRLLEKNESSEVSNKTTFVAEVQLPESCFEVIPPTTKAKSFQNYCNSIDSTDWENTEPFHSVFSIPESGVISNIKSELTQSNISKCLKKDEANCDLNSCDISTFYAPAKDCDLCGEQNIQVKHDINSNKVLEDDKCLVNTNCDESISSKSISKFENKLFNKTYTDSNLVLPDCENKSCDQIFNSDSTYVLSKSKGKSFCEISGTDTNFVVCESNKCIVPSKSGEEVNLKNGVKSIPDSFGAGEPIDCDRSIINTSMCKVNTENEYNITMSDLCNDLKKSKLSGTVLNAAVDNNVDSETSGSVLDCDVKLLKQSEKYLSKSVQNSDDLSTQNVDTSFSQTVKGTLNADANLENNSASQDDVKNNPERKYSDEKLKLPSINVDTLDLCKNSLFNIDKFLLSCSEQLLNNIPLFDFCEVFEVRQKSLLNLNNSFIYPDIVNFPNIFPDTESYLEQLAKCRNPNSFFMDTSEIPRRYFCSAEVKNLSINGKYSTPFENDSCAAIVKTSTHQGACLSDNKSEVTSQFSNMCSDNLSHAPISDRMDNSESAMNNGEENGEDVVRGKNRCQERCPEFSSMDMHLQGFATVVTHRDSDLRDRGSIDTPGITESSNVEEIQERCLREVYSEPTEPTPASEMLSSVSNPQNIISITVPTDFQGNSSDLRYNRTVDNAIYSCDEIRGRVGKPGVICDSLVYKRCKAGEGLEFLNLDNASEKNNLDSDKRFEKSRCVLAKLDSGNASNISRMEYSFSNENTNHLNVHSEEVSFPFSEYTQQSFTLHDALEDFATTAAQMDTSEVMKNKFNSNEVIVCSDIQSENDYNIPRSKCKQNQSLKNELECCAFERVITNSIKNSSQTKLPSLVQNKNLINRNKNSMIPCKTPVTRDFKGKESCNIDSKVKSKKSGPPMDDKINSVEQNTIKNTTGKSSQLKNNKTCIEHELVPAKKIHNAFPKHMRDNIKNRRNSLNENSGPVEFMVSIRSRDPSCRRHSESLANANNHVSNATDTNVLETSSPTYHASSKTISSFTNSSVLNQTFQVAFKTSNPTEVRTNILNRDDRKFTSAQLGGSENDSVDISAHQSASVFNVFDEDANVSTSCSLADAVSSTTPSVTSDVSLNETFEFDVTCPNNQDTTLLVNGLHSSCSSLPAVIPNATSVPLKHFGICLERNNLKSDVTSQEKSRIPKKQAGPRGAPSTSRPVRPPMWLSKAELTQEIQRLSSLCEIRTKELNRLKMETKHVSMGFDAFSALFKYLVEDLSALSVPNLTAELDSTLKKLELTKQDLAYYEREVEEIKAHHCQELNDLSNKLFEVFQTEVAELNAKHQEEINQLNDDHQKQIENLSLNFNTSSEEIQAQHEKLVSKLEQELIAQREEMKLFQEREIKDLEEKHTQSTKVLQEHAEQLQKKCAELKQHSMGMEDAMRKDTDSKLQWVTNRKVDLEKEVESLKTVLEMKNKELHSLRIQNLEMEKQLEELPFAREKIKMLQARAEDLEALMNEKTKLERKLSSENQQIRDTYEKESKVNRRLSMENEELQWRLRLAEQSLLTGSFAEVDETREETDDITDSSSKSTAPQILSKSVFFTFVDKDESSAYSPRTPYKRITPGFSSNYKTSPGKLSRPSSAPSPRKVKSYSEPPLPPSFSSTPRKMSKHASPKHNSVQKRQKFEPEGCQQPDETEIILSVTESMTSSASSENSVPEHKERLLEEHKEQIMASLEIIREQQSSDSSSELQMSQSMIEKQVSRPSNLETDMSRSAEFADPKAFYHMTFSVLKEPGTGDGDTEDSSKVSSCNSSKEITPITTHSISDSSSNYKEKKVEQNATKINVSMAEISTSITVDSSRENKPTKMKSAHSAENFENLEANNCDPANHQWRTI